MSSLENDGAFAMSIPHPMGIQSVLPNQLGNQENTMNVALELLLLYVSLKTSLRNQLGQVINTQFLFRKSHTINKFIISMTIN